MREPSGEKALAAALPECPLSVNRIFPVRLSRRSKVALRPTVRKLRLSGEKVAKELTLVGHSKSNRRLPVAKFQMLHAMLSRVAISCESGEISSTPPMSWGREKEVNSRPF